MTAMQDDWTAAMDLRKGGGHPLTLEGCTVRTWLVTIEPGHLWPENWKAYGRVTVREYANGDITLERGRMWPEHPDDEDDGA